MADTAGFEPLYNFNCVNVRLVAPRSIALTNLCLKGICHSL